MGSVSIFELFVSSADIASTRYHSAQDKSLPEYFTCFDCRVRADKNWELIELHELYPRMITKFKEVALFRQAQNRYRCFIRLMKRIIDEH